MKTSALEKHLAFQEKIKHGLRVSTHYLQYVLAFLIFAGILMRLISLPEAAEELLSAGSEGFHHFLKFIIDLVIGIELIHLLCNPNLDSVIEILLVAITRTIVLEEPTSLSLFLSVLAIAALFAIRKFLFVDKLDRHDEDFEQEALEHYHQHKKESER